MLALLIQNNWKEKAQNLETQRADCREILAQAEDTMSQLSPVPEGGWLSYIYRETIAEMFPDNFPRDERAGIFSAGKLFYLETLRTIFTEQEEKNGFSPLLSLSLIHISIALVAILVYLLIGNFIKITISVFPFHGC